jgi:regulator of protease activity HflC (stomatin/prohibitin superfamily)
MERNTTRNGLINLVVLLVIAAAAFAVSRHTNTLAGMVSVIFLSVGTLVAAVSWFQMRLERAEEIERLELEELAAGGKGSTLFERKDSEVFPAQRSREQFQRFFVPAFTFLLFLGQAAGAYFVWKWLSKSTIVVALDRPMLGMTVFGVFFLAQFVLGKYAANVARIENNRLLRPAAAYMLLGAYVSLAVGVGIAGVQAGFGKADFYLAYVLAGLLALISAETLLGLIFEIYRPRLKGKVERPLYESRLVGLLGSPEGLITTAAQALDYQFGFKVSDTWFYRFFEKAFGWLLLMQFGALLLFTMIVVIQPGEQALLERWGKPVEGRPVLGPGLHVKWFWPVDKVYRFQTEQIQSFVVGSVPEEKRESRVVLWTVSHSKEENFLVANLNQAGIAVTNQAGTRRTPPVSLLTVSIPVQYQITNLFQWAYENEDAGSLLKDLSTREVTRYFATADMNNIMSSGRLEASQELVRRIQAVSDERKLGAHVISAGLQDLHPPVKVAPDYEKVVGALQSKQARILAARADAIRTNAMAEAAAVAIRNRAAAQSVALVSGTLAQAAQFTNQIPAFQAAPEVYAQRAYLEAFTRGSAKARKYVLLTTNTENVIRFDLKDTVREDLSNLRVAPPKTK